MIFNSIEFAVFLPIVFAIYWLIPNQNIRLQNMLIVVASYVFYGWWDYRFLSLIMFSTFADFMIGWALDRQTCPRKRKYLLWASIVINLGLLGGFKYCNFFVENFVAAFTLLGMRPDSLTMNIVLPVGISFYTFQTLSYTIDVYREKLKPTKDPIAFAAFVSFFPQLVAGPIERATHLLPQFFSRRTFDYPLAVNGLRQILWGLFKKTVIADNCATYANLIFNDSSSYSGPTLLLGAIFFSFQIYGDFSGYSDIAIGTSRLFGFNLKQNFAFPYFSRDIAEFWRRWHISLSTWFRDYLYIPLGGSRGGVAMKIRNTFIIFLVSGFWHGANWTFIIWGVLHAMFFLPLMVLNLNRVHVDTVAKGRRIPSCKELVSMVTTFGLVTFAWIFFRADSLSHAFQYIRTMYMNILSKEAWFETLALLKDETGLILAILLPIFIAIEWLGREQLFAIERLNYLTTGPMRFVFYYLIVFSIATLRGNQQAFIYFQF